MKNLLFAILFYFLVFPVSYAQPGFDELAKKGCWKIQRFLQRHCPVSRCGDGEGVLEEAEIQRFMGKGAINFMRVCHGTLEDAKTTIGELYAWQFTDGPHLFDMRGEQVQGKRRDAGALELR